MVSRSIVSESVCHDVRMQACIYTLGQLNDTIVSGNVCHDVRAYRSGGYCLSQDQGSSNVLFLGNVCLRTTASPHNTHYGQNLTCE
jgi:hypothetical protein